MQACLLLMQRTCLPKGNSACKCYAMGAGHPLGGESSGRRSGHVDGNTTCLHSGIGGIPARKYMYTHINLNKNMAKCINRDWPWPKGGL